MIFNFDNIKALAQEKANRERNSVKIYYVADGDEYYSGVYYFADSLEQIQKLSEHTQKVYYSTTVYPESE